MGDISVWGWGGVGEWVGVSGWGAGYQIYKRNPFKNIFGAHGKIITIELFFTRKSLVKLFILNFIKEFLCKLIRDPQQKILQKNSL